MNYRNVIVLGRFPFVLRLLRPRRRRRARGQVAGGDVAVVAVRLHADGADAVAAAGGAVLPGVTGLAVEAV